MSNRQPRIYSRAKIDEPRARAAAQRALGELKELRGGTRRVATAHLAVGAIQLLLEQGKSASTSGREAIAMAVGALQRGIDVLNNLEDPPSRSNLLAVAALHRSWPLNVFAKKGHASDAEAQVSALRVGQGLIRSIRATTPLNTPESRCVSDFLVTAQTCILYGAREAANILNCPLAECLPLEGLPHFDRTERTFRILSDACWEHVNRFFGGRERLRTSNVWHHLPGAKTDRNITTVPASRIRERIDRALRQALKFP